MIAGTSIVACFLTVTRYSFTITQGNLLLYELAESEPVCLLNPTCGVSGS